MHLVVMDLEQVAQKHQVKAPQQPRLLPINRIPPLLLLEQKQKELEEEGFIKKIKENETLELNM